MGAFTLTQPVQFSYTVNGIWLYNCIIETIHSMVWINSLFPGKCSIKPHFFWIVWINIKKSIQCFCNFPDVSAKKLRCDSLMLTRLTPMPCVWTIWHLTKNLVNSFLMNHPGFHHQNTSYIRFYFCKRYSVKSLFRDYRFRLTDVETASSTASFPSFIIMFR